MLPWCAVAAWWLRRLTHPWPLSWRLHLLMHPRYSIPPHTHAGCVSTGKEANVYHASGSGAELAIKVYKTAILVFKDRDR